jgi:GNAT superfamily N-acetyltransferase
MAEIRRIRAEAPVVRELLREATDELAQRYPEDDIGISERGLSNLETQFRIGAVHEDEFTAVAVEDSELVGFVSPWISRGRATPGVAGEIDWLWARPDAERTNIERGLSEHAIDWLRQAGAGPILKLDDAQHPRRDLWESLGFVGDAIRFSKYED